MKQNLSFMKMVFVTFHVSLQQTETIIKTFNVEMFKDRHDAASNVMMLKG